MCCCFSSLTYECSVHMTAKSTSELACAEACWAGRAWTPDYSALLTALSKQSSRLAPSKMISSFPPPTAATDNTSTPRFPPRPFLPPLQKSGNLCFGVHACREAREMEEGCRTSRHVTVWTGMQRQEGREGCVLDEEEEWGEKHLSPLS